jgi:hypothetical protein
MKKLGVPTTYAELVALEPQTGQDATPAYVEYIRLSNYSNLTADQRQASHMLDPGLTPSSTPGQRHQAANTMRPFLTPLIQGSKCPRWACPEKGFAYDQDTSEMFGVRRGVRLLCEIARADAESGEPQDALNEIQAAIRISGQQAQAPDAIWDAVAADEERQALDALGAVMVARRDDPVALQNALDILQTLPPQPNIWNELAGGLLSDLAGLQMNAAYRSSHKELRKPDEIAKDLLYWRQIALDVHMWRESFQQMEKGKAGWEQVSRIFSATAKRHRSDPDFSPEGGQSQSTPEFASLTWSKQLATRRVFIAAVNVLLSRAKSGVLPSTLPNSGEDTVDPYTGRPLIYRPTSDAFSVYSVGPNRRDDNGISKSVARSADYDIVYSQGNLGPARGLIPKILGGVIGALVAAIVYGFYRLKRKRPAL